MFKKILVMVVAIALIVMTMSVTVSAATTIKPVQEWVGASIMSANGDGGKDNALQVRTAEFGVNVTDHPVWGCETAPLPAKNKSFTIVVEVKVIDDDNTPDDADVFALDPKIRATDATGNIVDEPEDQPYFFSASDINAAPKDAKGFSTFYYVLTPDVYNDNATIKIENRLRYKGMEDDTNTNRMSIAIRRLAVYDGDVVKQLSGNTAAKTTAPAATKAPSQAATTAAASQTPTVAATTVAPTETPSATIEATTPAAAVTTAPAATQDTTNKDSGSPVVLIVIIVIIVAAAAVAGFLFIKKKKSGK